MHDIRLHDQRGGKQDLAVIDKNAEIWTNDIQGHSRLYWRLGSKRAWIQAGFGLESQGMPAEFIVTEITFGESIIVECLRRSRRAYESDPEKFFRYRLFISKFK